MTSAPPPFLQLINQLTDALRQETMLARAGALAQLNHAAAVKREAFEAFRDACMAHPSDVRNGAEQASEDGKPQQGTAWEADPQAQHHARDDRATEQAALRDLLMAANESALVLEAVKRTLDEFVARLKAAVGALADAGTYGPQPWRCRDVVAVRLDASA
jgi:chorismate mutase